jgi:hypothetical protein
MYKPLYDDMKKNGYNPSNNTDIRFLTIMACHTNTKLKLESAINNLTYLTFKNNDIVVINSENVEYATQLKDATNSTDNNIEYLTIPNDTCCDFGKWVYSLNNINNIQDKYDYVVFINDSIIIKSSINHFFNIMVKNSVELYGYTDSTEIRYHYQSYLFGISSKSCYKLIDMLNNNRSKINTFNDLIVNMELPLIDTFTSHDCFIKLGRNPENIGKNIYFGNDALYTKLFYNQLLPFVKIKKITPNTLKI